MRRRLRAALALAATLAIAAPAAAQEKGDTVPSTPTTTDRVAVNGVELYYEVHGEGSPLVMLHGGVNPSDMFGAPLAAMAKNHKVVAVHMRGHGFSTDTDEPWWDAFPTAASVIGQWLLGRKYVENWPAWVIVNVVSVALFAYKGLWLTVLLYVVFIAMSFAGWRAWQRLANTSAASLQRA